MIALRTVWRYLPGGSLETTPPGGRCDWAEGGVYEHLGRCARIDGVGSPSRSGTGSHHVIAQGHGARHDGGPTCS